jgi:pyruvate/2-oxoglutarate dehydrogenase complex dihydrolipoamide acyltransferase (E2) component
MHQAAMETLCQTLERLKLTPVEHLTTFGDLEKIFIAAEEVVASSQLLGIIQSDTDAEEEKEETAEEETAESISEELLESSPQTDAPKAQDEMPSQSQTMEAGAN